MYILSNLAISVDGKIAPVDGSLFHLGTAEDRKKLRLLRSRSDAVLMGASTLRAFQGPLLSPQGKSHALNLVLSSRLEGISPKWKFFTDHRVKRVLFHTANIPSARKKAFEGTSELVRLSKGDAAPQIIEYLARRGVRKLLVEGGGSLVWDFASKNLIDEYHVTVTPRILGGIAAPTLVDGKGFRPHESLNLRLAQCKVVGDELYLVYRKTAKRG